MRIRANLRAALHDGPLTYSQLRERFDGANILPSLSQMVANGQLLRSGAGNDAKFTIGQVPRRGRPPKTATLQPNSTEPGTRREGRSPAAPPARRGRPPKSPSAGAAKKRGGVRKTRRRRSTALDKQRPARGRIENTIIDLLKRRDAIDRAIAALEELARTLR
ncbi:MAG: hypothetical protein HYY28_06980 [Betaproteobacteria bacterium]|nr:hypothetical protein [Betaproteobacteria bacterium]